MGIKKLFVVFALYCFVFLVGCDNESAESTAQSHLEHTAYLKSFGWHVEDKVGERKQSTKNYLPAANVGIDLKPYEEIEITTYLLKEKQKSGKKIFADIYEANGDIVGGSGHLETWEPGDFSLKDKKRLIKEGTINK
ncbi:DUF4830 domain-containing protein [Cohnella sp. 56]|uniref:DUF4830 domain-containing protein n=1 Tax=Cohnella sp. 56 TaxID=3113722 RepID=UPI0030EAE411